MLQALRFIYAILLLGIAAFAVFGFLATFEPSDHNVLTWRVGYAAVGVGALIATIWLVVPGRRARP